MFTFITKFKIHHHLKWQEQFTSRA